MNQKKKTYYSFLLAILLATMGILPSYAQGPITVSTSTRKILIGDQVNVFLKYQQRGSDLNLVRWTSFPDSLQGLVWVERGAIDTIKQNDSVILKQKLTVTGFDSGAYFIPAFSFVLKNAAGGIDTVKTDSLLIQVQTVAVDTAQPFKPIKDVQAIPITWRDYIGWIIGGLILAGLLVWLILKFIKKQKNKPKPEAKVPPEKAHEKALRMLDELATEGLWQKGKVKEYYDRLSLILRSYLENRFQISAMESTTEELLKTTHNMRELKPFRKELRMIFQTSDLAKFAKAQPSEAEHENCFNTAKEIVEKTKITDTEGGRA